MKGLVLTYLLTYCGAAVALFNPFVGVCVYWILEIVRPQYMFSWAGAGVGGMDQQYSQIVAIATILGWAARGFGDWRFGKGGAVVVFFALSSVWIIVSALAAPQADYALHYVQEDLKRLLMFTICVTTATSTRRLVQLAWVFTAAAGYVGYEMNIRYLGGFNEAQWLGFAGMDNNCLGIAMVTYLGVALFLGLYVRPWWQKGIAFGAALFIGHTVLLTFSRGAMLGMMVSGAVALIVIPKRSRTFLAVTAAIVIALSLAGTEVRDRFMTSFAETRDLDGAALSRKALWLDSFSVIQKYPLLGAGPDHFPLIANEFGWKPGKEAHSMWLQLGAEVGVPAVLFLSSAYLLIIARLWPLARKQGKNPLDRWSQSAACMGVTSLAGFMVSSQFVSLEGLEAPLYVAAMSVGALRLAGNRATADASQTAALPSVAAKRPTIIVAPANSIARPGLRG